MPRRNRYLALALLLVVLGSASAALVTRGTGPTLTASARSFLASLDGQQRATASVPYEDERRVGWHFIPLAERKGLQIKYMSDQQRQQARALLASALSEVGYQKATTIMELEAILRELEKSRQDGPIRDPERYYFTVFGQPAADAKWGLSVEGHHLSLNFVVDRDQVVSHTPAFLGANPATVRTEVGGGPKRGTRVLAQEETLGFDLINSLSDEQRKTAIIAEKAPHDLRGAGEPQPPQSSAEGIATAKLTPEQTQTLRSLIQVYADNMPAELAQARVAEIEKAGLDNVYFAWAGALEPGIGHYYRVQGPTFLIEFVNTQPDSEGNPANHIHSVWRDMRGDFAIPIK